MMFDCIIANPPYAKIGVEIVNKIINEVPHKDIIILGTGAMLSKHNDHLDLEYVYIEGYILEPVTKCKWVRQIILLGHKGSCKAIPATCYGPNVEIKPNEIRAPFCYHGGGQYRMSVQTLLVRSRLSSVMLSLSDEDYEYIKTYWKEMSYIERFWWLHDRGLYKRFIKL